MKNVENTYLTIFQALGGSVVARDLRNFDYRGEKLWERRHEQALLGALVFHSHNYKVSDKENGRIIFWGLTTVLSLV